MKAARIFYFLILLIDFPLGAQNLIPNPGFEEGILNGHTLIAINDSEVKFSGSATNVFQGDSALKIDISVVGTGGPQVIGIRHTLAGLEAGKKYSFKAAIQGPTGQKVRFRVHGDGKQTMSVIVNTSAFQVYEFVIDALAPAADGDHLVALDFGDKDNSAGSWYVDNLVFEKIDNGGGGEPGTLDVVYVSQNGLDTNEGSRLSPLKTLGKAYEMLAGDTIYMLEGSYHEEVIFENFSGTEVAPKVIMAEPGNDVVFDGTIPLESAWQLHEGQIYKTTLSEDIWQVFVNGEMLNLCRWPNVEGYIEDEQPIAMDPLPLSLWDQHGTWGHSADTSSNGLMIDDGAKGLGSSGLDMTGAIAVLNVGSFKSSAAPVLSHTPGEDKFTWDPAYTDPFLSWQKPMYGYYYLEGKLNLLDRPGEWYYDKGTKELYVYLKDGSDPGSAEVRGKIQTYALTLNNCDFLEIKDINFFGTTLKASSCSNLTIENCEFSYPSYSKRILGNYESMQVTTTVNGCQNLVFRNNIIQYSEGEALHHDGNNALLENNLMRHIDFSCANLRMLGGTVNFKSDDCVFRNNTIYIAGASETLAPGSNNTVEGNDIWGVGHLQNDGSMVQYMVAPAVGSVTRFNWLHDCKKSGMRYDGSLSVGNTNVEGYWEPWGTQTKGQVYKNVIWNTPTGLMIKGDYHVIVNNTVFDNSKVSIIMMDPLDYDGPNSHSICKNNVGDLISGHRGGRTPDEWPIPGDHSNNWNGFFQDENVGDILSDIENRDFRPVSDEFLIEKGVLEVNSDDLFPEHTYIDSTFDIGAYEHGDTIYNIPGRREALPSHPVPANTAVSNAAEIMMAWRPAYRANSYRLYMGNSFESVSEATMESNSFIGEQSNNMYIPDTLKQGEQVYWRVDALVNETLLTGDVWSFYAGEDTSTAIIDTISNVKIIVESDGTLLPGAEVIFNGQSSLTDQQGEVTFSDLVNGNSYSYSIQLSGYETATGDVFLESDTTLQINLVMETGIETVGELLFRVYPNPAKDIIRIHTNLQECQLEMVNSYGQIILHSQQLDAKGIIDVSAIQPGVYMLVLTDQNLNSAWKSVIIVD